MLNSRLPGGNLTVIIGAVLAALAGALGVYRSGRAAGRDQQKAKEADAYERHLQDIERAARARNSVDTGGMPDDR